MGSNTAVIGSQGHQAFLISATFVAISAVFVIARLIVRLSIVRGAGADDWIILGSLVSTLPQPYEHRFFDTRKAYTASLHDSIFDHFLQLASLLMAIAVWAGKSPWAVF